MKVYCEGCDRYRVGGMYERSGCCIPVEWDSSYCHHTAKWVDSRLQNADNDCPHFLPKRPLVQKVVEFFWRKT